MKRLTHKNLFQDENNVSSADNIEVAVSNLDNDGASPEEITTSAVILDSNITDEQDGEDKGESEDEDDEDEDDDDEDDEDEEEDDDDEQNGAFLYRLQIIHPK